MSESRNKRSNLPAHYNQTRESPTINRSRDASQSRNRPALLNHNRSFSQGMLVKEGPNWASLIPPMPNVPQAAYNPAPRSNTFGVTPVSNVNNDNHNLALLDQNNLKPLNSNQRYSMPASSSSSISEYHGNINHSIDNIQPNPDASIFTQRYTPTKSTTAEDLNQKHTNISDNVSHQKYRKNSGETKDDSLAHNQLPYSKHNKIYNKTGAMKKKKYCKGCGKEITGQFVRALGNAFHVECFKCNECGKPCSSKFFPYDVENEETGLKYQVAICEYDYFKKLDLICFNCNCALRGPYITALGHKYHLEHFRCHICHNVFGSEESYYEHEGNIYCHFHYSKLHASQCEGCQSSIVKQFVELYRGGRNQQWHPECYMVHKFWNVCIVADSAGLKKKFGLPDSFFETKKVHWRDSDISKEELLAIEQQIEVTVMDCWLTLCGYEEVTASCISDMLLDACTGDQCKGLYAAGKLILFLLILFRALDEVISMSKRCQSEEFSKRAATADVIDPSTFQQLRKEPRNIVGKIMSYLALLRKTKNGLLSTNLSSEVLSVITGCAHYLKLLIRFGLTNSLKINKMTGSTEGTDRFLSTVKEHVKFSNSINANISENETMKDLDSIAKYLYVPSKSTDLCLSCHKSIEKSCMKYKDLMWHMKCFNCSKCHRSLDLPTQDHSNLYLTEENSPLCERCHSENLAFSKMVNFKFTSELSQLLYLLKIAFTRSKSVFERERRSNFSNQVSGSNKHPERANSQNASSDYSKTLNDVTRLRTSRQNQKLSNSIKKHPRKSIILETPDAETAKHDRTADDGMESKGPDSHGSEDRKSSVTSGYSFTRIPNEEKFNVKPRRKKSLKISDEPQKVNIFNQLNRTSDLLKNEKSLTLDDIPRIVAAEQAREQRPNAFKHHSSLYKKQNVLPSIKMTSLGKETNKDMHGTGRLEDTKTEFPSFVVNNEESVTRPKYYSELSKSEHFILRHIAVEALVRITNGTFSREGLLPLIQTKKQPTFWDKFKFGSNDAKRDKTNTVFGVDLVELTKKYGIDSDLGVGPSKLRIPIIVDEIINALRQKDMSVEGIFRLNGNIKKLKEICEEINRNPLKSPDFSAHTAVQLAALMKKWLRELPNPLLTYNLFELWIASQKVQSPNLRKRILQLTYCMLPRSHRNLLEVLLYFFSWVASFAEIDEETGSKMDIYNLATVISPNVLRSKKTMGSDQHAHGENYFLGIEVFSQLIEHHEEFSIIPSDLLEFYDKCGFSNKSKNEHPTTKEVVSRIDKISKELSHFFELPGSNKMLSDLVNLLEMRTSLVSKGKSEDIDDTKYVEHSNT